MSRHHVTIVGDCLLDRDVEGSVSRLTPDGPAPVLDERQVRNRPGGAGLAAVLTAHDGHHVSLVTALAADDAGRELRALLDAAGIAVVDLGSSCPTSEKIRLRAGRVSLARWDRGPRTTPDDIGPWNTQADDALASADVILVSCYGRGISARADVRGALEPAAGGIVWDPHPSGAQPVPGAALVTPNREEAHRLVRDIDGDDLDAETRRAERLVELWDARGVAVTLGAGGALFTTGAGMPRVVPAPTTAAGDPCGAGDRFSSRAATALAAGHPPAEAVRAAVLAASRFVASGGAASIRVGDPARPVLGSSEADGYAVADQVRAARGTIVATGGCFDLLHAGHVQLLDAARRLGDCLIVLLNSDGSVRRLKGPDRPIVDQRDRAAMLMALTAVDGVVVFDEDTPVPVLEKLRPHIFAKGGDYDGSRIPEAEALAAWGGRAVTLPYLEDHATTDLVREVRRRGR